MADLHEKFEMSERDQDVIYMNQSSKYLTFDENGRPISGRNIGPDYIKNDYQLLEDNILTSRCK